MRSLVVTAAVLMLIAVFVAGACAGPAPASKPSPAAASMPWEKWPVTEIPAQWGWPEFFTTHGIATYYADAVAVAELVKRYSPVKTQAVQIGAGVTGVMAVIKGDALFNTVDLAVINAAFLSGRDFETVKPGGVRVMATGDDGPQVGIHVRAGSDIKTPYDLKGKRVAFPAAIPLWEITTEAILKAYGMTRNDVKVVTFTAPTALPDMMRQNLIDMFVYTIAPGTPSATDLTTTGSAFLMSIDPDKVDAAAEATGGLYPKSSLPARTFKGQDKEILGLSFLASMHLKSDVPESLAYTVTRILWDRADEYQAMASAIGKTFRTLKGTVSPATMKAGFHPGAIRYYKEKGVWGAEQEKAQQKYEDMLKQKLDEWQKKQK